jgi:hypothetical protein
LLDREGIGEIKVGGAEKAVRKWIPQALADRNRIRVLFGNNVKTTDHKYPFDMQGSRAALTMNDASPGCWCIANIFTRNR